MSDLRVGRISALNMYPIYHHLEQAALPGVTFTDGLPAALNAAVLDGRLHVSAMSSIAYARNADRLRLMPVGCIACEGAVDSIRLLSPVPLADVTRVAVTPHSASSVTLLRILLGPDVAFRTLDGPPALALVQGEAVLLIADEALEAHRDGIAPHSIDLGELWQQRTGLPMVFAVWAAREDATQSRAPQIAALADAIDDARAAYLADPGLVALHAAERFPFPPEYISAYLSRLRYEFGPAERAGLEQFLQMARAAGELDDIRALEPMAA
jgi:chorismate dehydratase